MEIWDERVRLQDARQRIVRLQQAFEPWHLNAADEEEEKREAERPLARRRPDLHWRRHLLTH